MRGGEIEDGCGDDADVDDVDASRAGSRGEGRFQVRRARAIVLTDGDPTAAVPTDQRPVRAAHLLEDAGIDVGADESAHVVRPEDVGIQHLCGCSLLRYGELGVTPVNVDDEGTTASVNRSGGRYCSHSVSIALAPTVTGW